MRKLRAQPVGDPSRSVEEAYTDFLSAQDRSREPSDAGDDKASLQLRPKVSIPEYEMISAMRDALVAYCRPSNHPSGNPPPEPFPPEMAFCLGVILSNALSGAKRTPKGLTQRGAGRDGYGLNRDKDAAARYLWAVSEGIISDGSENKTIQGSFGVDAKTVRSWRKRPLPPLGPELADLPPALLRKRIELLMKKAGEHYKRYGRSRDAISVRDPRR